MYQCILKRFWNKVKKSDKCWLWKGSTNGNRAVFTISGKTHPASRIAYLITKGPIPEGLQVCHHCDNGRCVNPDHLFLGTHKENTQDMINKGRHWVQSGDKHYKAKLTDVQISELRTEAASGIPRSELVRKYGVSQPYVSRIINKQRR